MSWQAYVDSSLVGSGHIDKAAIVSAAGDSTWASSAGFTVSTDELKPIVSIYSENGSGKATDAAHAEGLHIAGTRYKVIKIDERSIYLRQDKDGIIIVKTKQAILIGHYGDGIQAGNATQTVEALADYLQKVGY